MKNIFTLLVCFFVISAAQAQPSSKITGKTLFEGQPIPGANAYIKVGDMTYGSVTDGRGIFEFSVPKNITDGVVTISSMGFKKQEIPFSQFKPGRILDINLQEDQTMLSDVTVRSVNPYSVVFDVDKAIFKNYMNDAVIHDVDYTQTIMEDGEYVRVAQAEMKVRIPSYLTDKYISPGVMDYVTQASLLSYRATHDRGKFKNAATDMSFALGFFTSIISNISYLPARSMPARPTAINFRWPARTTILLK